jgi:hypothetical protein
MESFTRLVSLKKCFYVLKIVYTENSKLRIYNLVLVKWIPGTSELTNNIKNVSNDWESPGE